MATIGQDVNLATCRAEGYLMMDFNRNKLFKKGVLQKEQCVRFKATAGYLTHDENGKPLDIGTKLYVDSVLSWNDLMEIFERYKDEITSFADYANCNPNFENPNEYDLLNLASDINSYCGLE